MHLFCGRRLRGAWYQGLEVSLYDVSDPTRPFEVAALIVGKRGSETEVLGDDVFTSLWSNPASFEGPE